MNATELLGFLCLSCRRDTFIVSIGCVYHVVYLVMSSEKVKFSRRLCDLSDLYSKRVSVVS
jgi:hypothetical protein